jgi:hypothetical protein
MIDRIRIYKNKFHIEEKYLKSHKWYKSYIKKSNNIKYIKNLKNVRLEYYPRSERLIIDGRLINLYEKDMDRVTNFDDLFLKGIKIKNILENIGYRLLVYTSNITYDNGFLETYFKPALALKNNQHNILEFNVSYIEFCFNLKLESQQQVENYVTLFNLIALDKNDKRYINYAIDNNYSLSSGCYIKSNKSFEKYDKHRATINFYNKYSQLKNRISTPKEYDVYITDKDLDEAKNILRLEVQVGCKYLYEYRKNNGTTNELYNYFDVKLSYEIVKQKFEYFLGDSSLDFYSCKRAVDKIMSDDTIGLSIRQKDNLINYVNQIYRFQHEQYNSLKKVDYKKSRKYHEKLRILGIHNVFIPENLDTDFLINPIKILKERYSLLSELNIK